MSRKPWVAFMIISLCIVGLATTSFAADKKKPTEPRVVRGQPGTGQTPPATEATAWIQYDDGTREAWASDVTSSGGVAGNKFVSTWGTFYCDQVSVFMGITDTYYFYVSAYTGVSGTQMTGQTSTYFSLATTTTASDWYFVDGSTSPYGWLGNTGYVFTNTAWVGAYYYSDSYRIGIDTSGTDHHGWQVTYYTGTGYSEGPYNAMIRARFNGDGVPVELMGFTVE